MLQSKVICVIEVNCNNKHMNSSFGITHQNAFLLITPQSPSWAPLLQLILQLLLVLKVLDWSSLHLFPWVISCHVSSTFLITFKPPTKISRLSFRPTHCFAYQTGTSNIAYRKSLSSLNLIFVLYPYLNEWHYLLCSGFDSFPFFLLLI